MVAPDFREKLYRLDLQSQMSLLQEAMRQDIDASKARGLERYDGDPTLLKLNALVTLRYACVFDGPGVQELLKRACLLMNLVIKAGGIPDGTRSMCSSLETYGELLVLLDSEQEFIELLFNRSTRPESAAYLRVLHQKGMKALRDQVVDSTLRSIPAFSSGPLPGERW